MWKSMWRLLGAMGEAPRRWVTAAIVLALTVVAFSSIYPARDATILNAKQANERSSYDARKAREEDQRRCASVSGSPERLECAYSVERATREQQRREYEVAAERDSAAWDESMAKAAALGGIVGIITIVLLFIAYEGQLQTIKVTREIGEAQTRAYLSVSKCRVQFGKDRIFLKVHLRNSGQSPALNVCWYAEAGFVTEGDDGVRWGETPKEHRDIPYDVDAQSEREVMSTRCEGLALGAEEAKAFAADKEVKMGIRVKARGKDVFKNDLSTTGHFFALLKREPLEDEEVDISPSGKWGLGDDEEELA